MLADYSTTGLTAAHASARAAARPPAGATRSPAATSRRSSTAARVRVGGLVVARQRPGTASGVVFILLEDEFGTINLIVPAEDLRASPPDRQDRAADARRAGKLERFAAAGGAINVLVDQVGSIDAPDQILADIKDFSMLDEQVRRGLAEQRRPRPAGARRDRQAQGRRPRTSAPSRRR